MKAQEKYWFYLNLLTQIRHDKLERILDFYGSPEELYFRDPAYLPETGEVLSLLEMSELQKYRNEEELDKLWEKLSLGGFRYVSREHPEFPENLSEIPDCPFGLFVKGELPRRYTKKAAIVGARASTSYGKDAAHFFARCFAEAGIEVISGMALGVDGYAGRGAIAGKGKTYAVLAGGTDICYPRENIDLYNSIPKGNGGILSERPTGYRGIPRDFPLRNRIISGLADVTVVIEAAEKSGSLITVEKALSQNRDVFALPGRVSDRMSRGCNELLKSGAHVLTCPEDVIQYLGLAVEEETFMKPKPRLGTEEEAVYSLLSEEPVPVDTLLTRSTMPVSELSAVLVSLEMKGVVKRAEGEGYRRV